MNMRLTKRNRSDRTNAVPVSRFYQKHIPGLSDIDGVRDGYLRFAFLDIEKFVIEKRRTNP
jgi:hypothetical protein